MDKVKTKLSKEKIEELANEIVAYLKKREMAYDTILYYNNKQRYVNYGGHGNEIVDDVDPHDYFKYCAHKHILSMSFEGPLYEALNDGYMENWETENDLIDLFNKYGLYYELGDSWNLSLYPNDSYDGIEYTDYGEPEKEEYIFYRQDKYNLPGAIAHVLDLWKSLVVIYGVNGSCVIGDGIRFRYGGKKYFMSTNWNQSDSSERVISAVKTALNYIGATDISYDYGHLD